MMMMMMMICEIVFSEKVGKAFHSYEVVRNEHQGAMQCLLYSRSQKLPNYKNQWYIGAGSL